MIGQSTRGREIHSSIYSGYLVSCNDLSYAIADILLDMLPIFHQLPCAPSLPIEVYCQQAQPLGVA